MSEVEKLYRNVGVESVGFNPYKLEDEYPQFTAEKQLKILCFIVNQKHSVTFHDQVFGGDKLTLEKIQENLAWAINRIWKDLTEKEKEQIRTILNG